MLFTGRMNLPITVRLTSVLVLKDNWPSLTKRSDIFTLSVWKESASFHSLILQKVGLLTPDYFKAKERSGRSNGV